MQRDNVYVEVLNKQTCKWMNKLDQRVIVKVDKRLTRLSDLEKVLAKYKSCRGV